jgi:FkbM family methyltransferase
MDHHDVKNFELLRDESIIGLGDVVVDVGACHGTYTSFFSSTLGNTGKIYCVELFPENFQRLEMRFGHAKNIEFINAAISDSVGTESIYVGDSSEVHNIIGHNTSNVPNVKVGEIKSITLDKMLEDEAEIGLIKIDVEGAELKVLKGMTDVMKRTKAILIENHLDDIWPETRKILIDDNGFSCYNIEKDEDVTINSERPYQCLCRRVS